MENSEKTAQRAVELFRQQNSCSVSSFRSLLETFLPDKTEAWKAALGFGGGMSSGDVCGALTGAIMAIGMIEGERQGLETKPSDRAKPVVQELYDAFKAAFDTVDCGVITGCNMRDPVAYAAFRANPAKRPPCERAVAFTARWVAERENKATNG